MTQRCDAIVIGAGQAGPSLAMRLGQEGLDTVLVERRHLGGSCVNFGCTPTKAMVASARAAWMARRAHELGVSIDGEVRVDMRAVKRRRDAIVERSRSGLQDALRSSQRVTLIEGHARFIGPRRIQVGNDTLEAERIFINTGARTAIPAIPGLADTNYWTPSRVMEAESIPRELVILGGGPVGVEYAQMFHRFGSRVTLIERHARLLSREDTDVSEAIQQILEEDGVRVLVDAEAIAIEGADGRIAVTVALGEGATSG